MISTGLGGAILSVASDLFSDPGMRNVIIIAAGIPLAFLVIELIIGAFRHPDGTQKDPVVEPLD